MCQQILKFCSGSSKALLIAGSLVSLALAIAIGFISCTTNGLYKDIDQVIAQDRSLSYHLQLAAAGYCFLVALLGIYAAHYNQKHSIRVLAIITTFNCLLALGAIAMVPSGSETSQLFEPKLARLAELYDFNNKWPNRTTLTKTTTGNQQGKLSSPGSEFDLVVANSTSLATQAALETRTVRATNSNDTTKDEPTVIWDSLQLRGCCGLRNGTETWKKLIPKSCCLNYDTTTGQQICKTIDQDHQQGCLQLISATSSNLIIVLAFVLLVNFYLATTSCIGAYRTFHYDEASQSAYN